MVKENVLTHAGKGYVSPIVEVIEVAIEKGFAATGGTETMEEIPGVW